MRSKHAFCMLAPLRQSYTRRPRRSGRAAAIVVAMSSASCSESGESVSSAPALHDAGDVASTDATPDSAPASDAPWPAPDAEIAETSRGSDGAFADVADARVPLCLRLYDPDRPVKVLDLSADVRTGYLRLVAGDCHLAGLFPTRSAALAAWSNRLYDWNLDLWGCTDRSATGFALVHAEVTDLTSADAELLIGDYLLAATQALRPSPSEVSQMRQDLERLGQTAITRLSEEHPFSICDVCDAGTDANGSPPTDGACALDANGATADADDEGGG